MTNAATPFSLANTIKEAWSLIKGSKGPLWGINITVLLIGIAVMIGVLAIGTSLIIKLYPGLSHYETSMTLYIFSSAIAPTIIALLAPVIFAPFLAGTFMTAIKCARGETITSKTGYQYIRQWIPAAVVLLVTTFCTLFFSTFISYLLSHVFTHGIEQRFSGWITVLLTLFFSTLFLFALPLCIDKQQHPFAAIKNSAKHVLAHWFRYYAVYLITFIASSICAIPYLVSLFWAPEWLHVLGGIISLLMLVWMVPFSLLMIGVTYHKTLSTLADPGISR